MVDSPRTYGGGRSADSWLTDAQGNSEAEAGPYEREGGIGFSGELVRAIIRELERDAQILRFDERDDSLEIISVLARDAHLLFLDGGLHSDLGVLDEADDLLGLLHGDAILEGDALAHRPPRRRLGILDGQRLEVDAAPVELGLENVEDGLELHVVGRGEHEVHLLLGELVLGSLEVGVRLELTLGL